MVRHCVKPGITGLAQVSGFRGQIETDVDMINRIKLDVLYRKLGFSAGFQNNFSDCFNIIKGEEKRIKMERPLVSIITLFNCENLLLKPYNRCKIKLIRIGK
jgi:hypothetical protein